MSTGGDPTGQAIAPSDGAIDEPGARWRKRDSGPSGAAEAAATAGFEEQDEQDGGLEARLAGEQAKAEDYLGKWQRAAADMSNMRRRHEQDRQEITRQANARIIGDLLPVLDSFDRALALVPTELRQAPWVDGVAMVERQLRSALERNGVTPIEAEGKAFDPTEHEALMHEESDLPEGTVTGVLQGGYKLHDRVLRPAMVKVAKGS